MVLGASMTPRYDVTIEHLNTGATIDLSLQNHEDILQRVLDFYYPGQTDQRYLLKRDLDIHPLADAFDVVMSLVELGLVQIDRLNQKNTRKYNPHRRGMMGVQLVGTSIKFVVTDRSQVYESLKSQLYPLFKPTDRMFRFHLRSLLADGYNENEDLIDLLEKRGVLIIGELNHAATVTKEEHTQ